jgi:cell wall-associated NlpC family hydrolase
MKPTQQPRGLSQRRVDQLLCETKGESSAGSRIDLLSRRFLEHPYQPNPLIGSVDKAEVFVASLEGFDCVTYIETVLALALSSNAGDFIKWLRKIRYEDGRIQWDRRNHYMTGWIRNNVREGIVRPLTTSDVPIVSRERVLDLLPGLAARRTRVKSVPKKAAPRLARHLQSGDLIFFASTRKHLDIFHVGIIVRAGKDLLMRHASRSRGGVVEQDLSDFLRTNRMTGVIVVRPQEVTRASRFVTRMTTHRAMRRIG